MPTNLEGLVRAVVQRVRKAGVRVEGMLHAEIGPGLLILLGVGQEDDEGRTLWLAEKVARLRIFDDAQEKLNRSLLDVGGEALVVSQFTLYGDVRKGLRPSFDKAADPAKARELYEKFVDNLTALGVKTSTGVFQTRMLITLENDGPVTLFIESP